MIPHLWDTALQTHFQRRSPMNPSQVSHQIQLNTWADTICKQQQSGLNIKEWCIQNGLSQHQFFYWKRKLKEACLESALPEIVPLLLPVSAESSTTLTTSATLSSSSSLSSRPTFTSCTTPSIDLHVGDVSFTVSQDTPSELISKIIQAVRHA